MIERLKIKESKELPQNISRDSRTVNHFLANIPTFLKCNPDYISCYLEPETMDLRIVRWETDEEYENRIRIIEKDNITKILCGIN